MVQGVSHWPLNSEVPVQSQASLRGFCGEQSGSGTDLSSEYFDFPLSYLYTMGRDSSVGIATHYGLDGPGIESRWGRDFPHPSRPALGPTQPPVQWVPGISWG